MNKRISPRKPLKTQVIFEDEFGDEFVYFISTDISNSGIFIQTDLDFGAGTRVFLKFSLHPGGQPIRVAAVVMRRMAMRRGPGRKKPITQGLGLKFLGLKHRDYQKIEEFLSES